VTGPEPVRHPAMPFPRGFSTAFVHSLLSLHSHLVLNMPKGSKALKARQNNLHKARNSQKATVEEVPDEGNNTHLTSEYQNNALHSDHFHDDFHPESEANYDDNWDLDLGNDLPDIDCDNIPEGPQEPDLDEEIIVAPEITEEIALDEFSQFLFSAQAVAQKAEQARQAQHKRSKHYHGNAPRTKRHHRKLGRDLAEKGFLSIFDFIEAKKAAKLQNRDAASAISQFTCTLRLL